MPASFNGPQVKVRSSQTDGFSGKRLRISVLNRYRGVRASEPGQLIIFEHKAVRAVGARASCEAWRCRLACHPLPATPTCNTRLPLLVSALHKKLRALSANSFT